MKSPRVHLGSKPHYRQTRVKKRQPQHQAEFSSGAVDPRAFSSILYGTGLQTLTSSPPGRFMDDRSKTESNLELVSTFHLFC